MTPRILFNRIKMFKENWKLVLHFIFNTYYFGVNNKWRSPFPSMFGKPIEQRFNPLQWWKNYQMMKFRIVACHFLDKQSQSDRLRILIKRCGGKCMSEGVDTKLNGFNLENEVLKLKEDNVWMLRELRKLQDEVIKLHLAVRPTLDHNRKMSKPRTE